VIWLRRKKIGAKNGSKRKERVSDESQRVGEVRPMNSTHRGKREQTGEEVRTSNKGKKHGENWNRISPP